MALNFDAEKRLGSHGNPQTVFKMKSRIYIATTKGYSPLAEAGSGKGRKKHKKEEATYILYHDLRRVGNKASHKNFRYKISFDYLVGYINCAFEALADGDTRNLEIHNGILRTLPQYHYLEDFHPQPLPKESLEDLLRWSRLSPLYCVQPTKPPKVVARTRCGYSAKL